MTSNALPIALYQGLLAKLVTIIELIQTSGDALTPQNKQALFQATNAFKNSLNQAKELSIALPGGEMLTEEQDEVTAMLENLRDCKREKLSHFSDCVLSSVSVASDQHKMEIDSTASTPVAPN